MKKILLLSLFTILFSGWVYATHTLTSAEVVVTGGFIRSCNYTGTDKNIIIPATLDGQTIVGIADAPSGSIYGVFASKSLTSVQFPSTLERIGTNAFRRNSITSIDFSLCTSLTEISNLSFFENNLTSVNLDNCTSLLVIADAFGGWPNQIPSFNLPVNTTFAAYGWRDDRGTTYDGGDPVTEMRYTYRVAAPYTLTDDDVVVTAGVIVSCSYSFLLTDISMPETLDGETVIGIADGVFSNKSIYTLVLPTTIQTIGDDAFSGNNFTANLGSCTSLVSVGDNAFYGNRLTNIDFSEFPSLISIGEQAFENNNLTNINLSGNTSITSIPSEAFASNDIASVNLSNCTSLLTVDYRAFYGNELTSVDLNGCSALQFIKDNAFSNNSSLSGFALPTNTTHAALGWKDNDGNSYTAGQTVTDMYVSYRVPIQYTLTDDDVVVTDGIITSCSYDFSYTDIIIPTLLDGQTVLGIASAPGIGVFYDKEITSVQFPTSIETIGDHAFRSNRIVEIDLTTCTNLVSIGYRAFAWNLLSGYTLPEVAGYEQYGWNDENGISYMGGDYVTDLDPYYKAAIPYTLTSDDVEVVNGIIESCSYGFSLTNIIIPDTLDGQAVTGIVKDNGSFNVFADKGITSVQLPTTLEFLGYRAFYINILKGIDLSVCPSLDSIGDYAFGSNELDSINLSNSSLLRTIGDNAFASNSLTNLDFSSCAALSIIGDDAFYSNELTTLTFLGCNSLEIIGENAFSDNNNLSQIDLSSCTALFYIGEDAFNYCALSSFTLPTHQTYSSLGWRDGDWNSYNGGENVTELDVLYKIPIPYTLTDDDVEMLAGVIQSCSYGYEKTDIIIPETLDGETVIGIKDTTYVWGGVFASKGISSVKFPTSIQNIGESAFYKTSLFTIDLTACSNLATIGKKAFDTNLIKELDFSQCTSLVSIGDGAFYENNLNNLDLSSCTSLETIGNNAFQWNRLVDLNITACSSLKTIGEYAFRDNYIVTLSLAGCTSLTTIGEYAFYSNDNLTSVDLSDCSSLITIRNRAFYGCPLLTGFALPTPEVTGFLLDYWLEGTGVQHDGGATVTNQNTSYSAQLVSAYTATFNVSDGVIPIEGVNIDLDGYTPKNTDIAGQAIFTVAINDSIAYTVTATNYFPFSDSISVTDTNVVEDVTLFTCLTTSTLTENICEGETFNVGDSTYTETGTFVTTLPGGNQHGCDSIITLNLTVHPLYEMIIDDEICEGETYAWRGNSYTLENVYYDSLQSQYGCDSVYVLNLIVNPVYNDTLDVYLCEGSTYAWDGDDYTTAGFTTKNYISANGCDSIVTLNLMVSTSYCITYVPDNNFEQALIDLNLDDILDDYVSTGAIDTLKILDLNSLSISDLTGIEDFTGLTALACGDNQLTSVNINNNKLLRWFSCMENQLSSLDVSQNTALKQLYCSVNDIGSIDISNNTLLESFSCFTNQLTSLDVSKNTALITFHCFENQISSLDVSANTVLEQLSCYENDLSSLDVSTNTALISLKCQDNQIVSLDLANNTALEIFFGWNNQLTTLNVKNGQNGTLTVFNSTFNPNLTCIEVDDAAASEGYADWLKDATAEYRNDCRPRTYVPNDNFERELIALGLDDLGLEDNYIPTEGIDTLKVLNIDNKTISDLTGIEDFTALDTLVCSNNQIQSLDLSNCTNLLYLNCAYNSLQNLNLSINTKLTDLICSGNNLTSLDLSNNINLEYFTCWSNLINNLNVSQNTKLYFLSCGVNQLSTLDISNNVLLTHLDCYSNHLQQLDVSTNNLLVNLYCQNNNNLSTLDVSNNVNLKRLRCSNIPTFTNLSIKNTDLDYLEANANPYLLCIAVDNPVAAAAKPANEYVIDSEVHYSTNCNATYVPDDNFEQAIADLGLDNHPWPNYVWTEDIDTLKELDVNNLGVFQLNGIEDFLALEFLECYGNNLIALDINNNLALKELDCEGNNISALDVSNNTNLEKLYCGNNLLSTLDISNNPLLVHLRCNSNNLQQLDFSSQSVLETLYCQQNSITTLDVSNNSELINIRCFENAISQLDVSANTKLQDLKCSNNQIISLDVSTCTDLVYCICENNLLTDLNAKNGNNANLTDLITTGNANLFCIQVDDPAFASTHPDWIKDSHSAYIVDCSAVTYVPDDNFEQVLIDLNLDITLDNWVETTAIDTLKVLDLNSLSISDLTGIEDFTGLTALACGDNQLTSIDISNNTLLKWFSCMENQLSSLDVSQNTALQHLYCSVNDIGNIDISNNTLLESFSCFTNQITSLDVSNNSALTTFYCFKNQISSLDVSTNTALEQFSCYENDLSSLDVSTNTALISLKCQDNQIVSLDLTTNTSLEVLFAWNNQLTTVNSKNGTNNIITAFNVMGNPNLICIEVDDPAASATNPNWNKDATADYRSDCRPRTYIPDNNFERELIALGLDDLGIEDNYVPTEGIDTLKVLDVHDMGIDSLTGIEAFVELKELYCNENNLANLDVNTNIKLESLECDNNNLNSIDVSMLSALYNLECSNNNLSILDVSNNTLLEYLNCQDNLITTLDVSSNNSLIKLKCENNQLLTLNIGTNSNFQYLDCGNNQLTELAIDGISAVEYIECDENDIITLDATNNMSLSSFDCAVNALTELVVKNGSNDILYYFNAENNPDLFCIEVDDTSAYYSTNKSAMVGHSWKKDNQAEYAEECVYQCEYTLSSSSASVSAEAISISVEVEASSSQCKWIATEESLWISLEQTDSIYGNATLVLKVNANPYARSRTAVINIAGIGYTVNQQGAECTFTLPSSNQDFNYEGGSGSFTINTFSNCLWTAYTSCNWLTIINNIGAGTGSVDFTVDPNSELTERTCIITVAGETYTITQEAMKCTYVLSDTMAIFGYQQDTGSFTVSSDEVCVWQATSNCDWITLNTDSGTGNGTVSFDLSENTTDTVRTCEIAIEESIFTVVQDAMNLHLTFVPDDNFEQVLIDLGFDDVLDDSIKTMNIDTIKALDVSNKNITDLTGIEDFIALTAFNCANNSLVFGTLKPCIELPFYTNFSANFVYAPQADIGIPIDTTVRRTTPIEVTVVNYMLDNADNFAWYKDGVQIGITDILMSIASVEYADSGTYVCHITNAIAPELTLTTQPVTIKVDAAVGIASIEMPQLKIYPNPANDKVFIETGISRPVMLQVLDIRGKQMKHIKEFTSGEINVSGFATGIYIIQIANENRIATKRLIVR